MKFRTSLKFHSRSGLTLVEVVAGIALLSTLLVSILMSYGAHAGQIRAARQRVQAIEAADRLLSNWMTLGELPAVGDQDMLPGSDELVWRMVAVPRSERVSLPDEVGLMRLEVYQRSNREHVLTSVDLFTSGAKPAGVML